VGAEHGWWGDRGYLEVDRLMIDPEAVEIRSFRRITHMEHRLYRGFKVPATDFELRWPGGLPWRGFMYFVWGLAAILVAGHVYVIGTALGIVHPVLKFMILPAGLAVLAMKNADRTDGLPPHVFAVLWARERLTRKPRDSSAWSAKLGVRWDEHATRLHRSMVRGPARVTFREPVGLQDRWNGWWAEGGDDGEPRTVEVRADQALKVRP
jgi:hypothetical protein